MREREIERKLVAKVKECGGICPKFVSPGFDGMPDRVVLLPHGKIGFVEVKRPGEEPRPLQVSRHELLRRLGFIRPSLFHYCGNGERAKRSAGCAGRHLYHQ